MISIYAQGSIMDTDDQTAIGFQKDNPFFTGGDNTVPHTWEFTLPDTQTNSQLLSLGRHFEMPGWRHRVEALLTFDSVRIPGWLYLLQWTGSRYSMLFETGRPDERLSQPLRDWWDPALTLNVVRGETIAKGGAIPAFGWYSYDNGYQTGAITDPTPLFPTCNLGTLLTSAATAAGYSLTYPNTPAYICADRFGLVLPTMDVYTEDTVQLTSWVPATGAGTVTVAGGGTLASIGLTTLGKSGFKRGAFNSNKTVHIFKATKALTIEFRAGTAPNVSVVTGKGYDFHSRDPRDMMYLPSGSSCTFDLETGDYFAVVATTDWRTDNFGIPTNHWRMTAYETPVDCKFKVKSRDGQAVVGQTLNLVDNLPDISFIELLQAYCNMCNLYYEYDHAAGSFTVQSRDNIVYDNTKGMFDEVVADKGAIVRYIDGYARHNGVECKSADYVTEESRYRLAWECENDALEDEGTTAVVPFNEGLDVLAGGTHTARLLDVESADDGSVTYKGVLSVIFCGNAGEDARHINTITAEGGVGSVFRQVTDTASECEYRVKMSLERFLKIGSRDTWVVRGKRCYMRTGSWSGGFATMRLVEVEQ